MIGITTLRPSAKDVVGIGFRAEFVGPDSYLEKFLSEGKCFGLFAFGLALHAPFIAAHGAFAVLQLGGQNDLDRNLRNARFKLALLIILPGNADVFRMRAHENR